MTAETMLTAGQIADLLAVLGERERNLVLVAAVHPDGTGWKLSVHALPSERRDSIAAACQGVLRVKKPRKPKPSLPKDAPR